MEQYIDKYALVAEIENIRKHYIERDDFDNGWNFALDKIISFLDTIEVKEVELDFQRFAKEMETVFALPSSETKNTEENPLNWEYAIAKHFFELGLKVNQDVDLELVVGWFDHIAQIADDRKTANGVVMEDWAALDEIKCLAKESSEFIKTHYKAQKGK